MAWDTENSNVAVEAQAVQAGCPGLGAKLIEAHLPHTVADALSRTRRLEDFESLRVDFDRRLETLEPKFSATSWHQHFKVKYHSLAAV